MSSLTEQKYFFSLTFDLANKLGANVDSLHVLNLLINLTDKYIKNISIAFTLYVDSLKTEVYSLLYKSKKLSRSQEIDKCVSTIINKAKMLLKKIDDQIITEEVLILLFTCNNDYGKEILYKFNINYDESKINKTV